MLLDLNKLLFPATNIKAKLKVTCIMVGHFTAILVAMQPSRHFATWQANQENRKMESLENRPCGS